MTWRQRKTLSCCECDSWGFWLVWPLPPSPLVPPLLSPLPPFLSSFTLLLLLICTCQAPGIVLDAWSHPCQLSSLPLLHLSLLPREMLLNTLSLNNSRGRPLFSEFPREVSGLWFIWLFHTSAVRAGGRTVSWASGGGGSRPMVVFLRQILGGCED